MKNNCSFGPFDLQETVLAQKTTKRILFRTRAGVSSLLLITSIRSRFGVDIFRLEVFNHFLSCFYTNFLLVQATCSILFSQFEAQIVLRLFLIFAHFQPRCSYKVCSYKKKKCIKENDYVSV